MYYYYLFAIYTRIILKFIALQSKDIFIFSLSTELVCTGWTSTGCLCTGWLAVRHVWKLSVTHSQCAPCPASPCVCPAQCCCCRCLLGGALKFTHLLNILLSGQCPRTRIHMCVSISVCVWRWLSVCVVHMFECCVWIAWNAWQTKTKLTNEILQ